MMIFIVDDDRKKIEVYIASGVLSLLIYAQNQNIKSNHACELLQERSFTFAFLCDLSMVNGIGNVGKAMMRT